MDLHRLRIVEFDTLVSEKAGEKYMAEECKLEDWKTSTDGNKDETGDYNQCLDDNTSPPGLSKKFLDDKISPPGTSKKYLAASPPGTSKKCPDDKICPPGTSEKYLDDTTSTSPPETSKKDNFASSKLKSEIFKIPPKNKPQKRDLKINSSDIGLKTLFRDSAHLHQKKRTFNLRYRNSRLHHKVENDKEKKEKNEEVHFLFARETPSFINYCKKRAKNDRTTTQKKRDYELPNDIYGFQKSTRSMDQHQYRTSCYNFIDTDKIPFKKLRRGLHRKPRPPQPVEPATNCACKHHAMRVLNSACEIVQSPSICYNLGTHPQRSQTKHDNDHEDKTGRELSYCTQVKDETVEVSPSSLEFVEISCRDAGTGPSKVELSAVSRRRPPCACECPVLENDTITSQQNQEPSQLPYKPKPGAAPARNRSKKKRYEIKKIKLIPNDPVGFISRVARQCTGYQAKKRLTGESCVKYVFIGLLIVVWSPCLLAVFLAWVVMFPVKLTSILKMDRVRKKGPRCEYQRMCFENYLPKNKKNFITSATNWYSRTVGTVANAMTSLLRLKKKSTTGAASSFLPSSHPNRRKRYTLFYADNRGWVMKPLRRRNIRPSASTRVVQSMRCDVRPKLRCHLPQELKKACPVQVDNSYLRHKSKAADAYPMRCTDPWPKCNCWIKYSQGSSMFSRLGSRYHRRQQQNSTGLRRRTGTAEGGVQQPYPDFNRASMYSPGQNPPRKQSKPIPGLNRQPSTNKNYTPPQKYGRDPCYSNPANKCAPKSPYGESARRCAYKCLPCRPCRPMSIRCTPPKEQLPRVVRQNKPKANKKKACAGRKKGFCKRLRDLINKTDAEAWPVKVTCHPKWIDDLKNKPCFGIYKMCPRLYPAFLNFYKHQQYFGQMFVYLLTFCFWSPLVLCGYLCCNFIRKSC